MTEKPENTEEETKQPSDDSIDEGVGQLIGQAFGIPAKSQAQKQAEQTRNMSERDKRRMERMQQDPEMIQARQELRDEFIAAHPRYAKMSDEELYKEMKEHAEEDDRLRKQKLRNHIETFSDGMIAIIITIMLLEIPVPGEHVSYFNFIESVGVFLISFVITANFWFNRHKIFALTEEITEAIIVQDFVFTGLLSLIPLLTKWIMENPTSFSDMNYGIVLVLILLQQEGLSYGISKQHFKNTPKSFKFWRKIWRVRLIFTLFVNILITVIAIVTPRWGHWLFVVVPIFYFVFRLLSERNSERNFDEQFESGERAVGVPFDERLN